jgi:hypothetical protein
MESENLLIKYKIGSTVVIWDKVLDGGLSIYKDKMGKIDSIIYDGITTYYRIIFINWRTIFREDKIRIDNHSGENTLEVDLGDSIGGLEKIG